MSILRLKWPATLNDTCFYTQPLKHLIFSSPTHIYLLNNFYFHFKFILMLIINHSSFGSDNIKLQSFPSFELTLNFFFMMLMCLTVYFILQVLSEWLKEYSTILIQRSLNYQSQIQYFEVWFVCYMSM